MDPSLRRRVTEAAQGLGLNLVEKNKAKAIAFALCNRDVLHAFHSRILVGAEAECAARGWEILFLQLSYPLDAPGKQLHLSRVVQRRDIVRAVILAGTNSQNLLDLLTKKEVTFAVLGNNVLETDDLSAYDTVFFDDMGDAYQMTGYFQASGHSRIWFVGNTRFPWIGRCSEGYRRAMEEAGLPHCIEGSIPQTMRNSVT